MAVPFGTVPVLPREKKSAANLSNIVRILGNFKTSWNEVPFQRPARKYDLPRSNRSRLTTYNFDFGTYLTFIIVEPSCLAMSFRWSQDALHSLSSFPMFAASSSKSIFDALVTAPIWTRYIDFPWFRFSNDTCMNYSAWNKYTNDSVEKWYKYNFS